VLVCPLVDCPPVDVVVPVPGPVPVPVWVPVFDPVPVWVPVFDPVPVWVPVCVPVWVPVWVPVFDPVPVCVLVEDAGAVPGPQVSVLLEVLELDELVDVVPLVPLVGVDGAPVEWLTQTARPLPEPVPLCPALPDDAGCDVAPLTGTTRSTTGDRRTVVVRVRVGRRNVRMVRVMTPVDPAGVVVTATDRVLRGTRM
jgi:hypothetical protein